MKKAERQSMLKSILDEMKVRFEDATSTEETLLGEKDFFAKIDQSIAQAENGNTIPLPKSKQREFLGL